ncbi:MAG: hypothetical protein MUP70_04455 [Candidatus Aminicenantes bacterium]|nr:hypothetical protein [Candidatus Aminicenantes bacterium]
MEKGYHLLQLASVMKNLQENLSHEDVRWIFADWLPEEPILQEGLVRSIFYLKNTFSEQNIMEESIEALVELPRHDLKWALRRNLGEDKSLFKDATSVERVVVLVFKADSLRIDIAAVLLIIHLMESAARHSVDLKYEPALSDYVSVFFQFKVFKDFYLAETADRGKNRSAAEKQILSVLNRIEEYLMRCLQHYLLQIDSRPEKDILGFIEHLESMSGELVEKFIRDEISGGTVSILKEFSDVLRIRLEERYVAFIVARSLNDKGGGIRTHRAGHEVQFIIKSAATTNNIRIEAVVSLGKEEKNLLMHVRVMVEKDVTSIFVNEGGDYYDILHNYLLNNRNELLERILSIMYIVTPPDAVFYIPLSEQARQSLLTNRKDDGSLAFIKKISEMSGFPPAGHKFVETKDGTFLRCKKARIFNPEGNPGS